MTATTSREKSAEPVPDGLQPSANPCHADGCDPVEAAVGTSSAPAFPRAPGESPRAYAAFLAYFQLGHGRTLRAVAERLGEQLPTVKNWSSKFDWRQRLQDFHAGLLNHHARQQAGLHQRHAAEWAARAQGLREQEWRSAQKLVAAADSFLESISEEDFRRMTLEQAARALSLASAMSRAALAGSALPETADPDAAPLQQEILDAVRRVYATPDQEPAPPGPGVPAGEPPAGAPAFVSGQGGGRDRADQSVHAPAVQDGQARNPLSTDSTPAPDLRSSRHAEAQASQAERGQGVLTSVAAVQGFKARSDSGNPCPEPQDLRRGVSPSPSEEPARGGSGRGGVIFPPDRSPAS